MLLNGESVTMDEISPEMRELIVDFVDGIYDTFDADHSESLEFDEVMQALQKSPEMRAKPGPGGTRAPRASRSRMSLPARQPCSRPRLQRARRRRPRPRPWRPLANRGALLS